MMNESQIRRLSNASKEFYFEGSVLTVRGYYESDLVMKIDISKLTPEMLEELAPDEDEWEEDEEW